MIYLLMELKKENQNNNESIINFDNKKINTNICVPRKIDKIIFKINF